MINIRCWDCDDSEIQLPEDEPIVIMEIIKEHEWKISEDYNGKKHLVCGCNCWDKRVVKKIGEK